MSLSLAESFADLKVELHEAHAGLRKIPAGAHHSQTARLTQSLVPEVNVQQRLHGIIPLTAKYVIRPQAPEGMKGSKRHRRRFIEENTYRNLSDLCKRELEDVNEMVN